MSSPLILSFDLSNDFDITLTVLPLSRDTPPPTPPPQCRVAWLDTPPPTPPRAVSRGLYPAARDFALIGVLSAFFGVSEFGASGGSAS